MIIIIKVMMIMILLLIITFMMIIIMIVTTQVILIIPVTILMIIAMLRVVVALHSAKGGAVETGCSDLYDVIYQFAIYTTPIHCTPHPLHPPSAEYPIKGHQLIY